jgi:hypothetical protein
MNLVVFGSTEKKERELLMLVIFAMHKFIIYPNNYSFDHHNLASFVSTFVFILKAIKKTQRRSFGYDTQNNRLILIL